MIRRKRIVLAITVAVGLLATAAGHWSLLNSRWDQLRQLEAEAERLAVGTDEDQIQQRVTELRREVDRHESALPSGGKIGELLEELGGDLSALNVTGRSLTTGTPSEHGEVQTIPLNLAFTGSFDSAFELMQRLQAYDRIVRVDRIAIRRSDRAEDADSLSVTARLLTFERSPEEGR